MADIELHIDAPSERQKLFLQDRHKHVAFGGARGGGKSWAVRTKAKLLALRYPGIRMLIVRRTYKELTGNHIEQLKAETYGCATYNNTEKELTFCNGSKILFTYCANDNDLMKLQGQEFDVVFLDEATQLSEYQMKAITACVRGVNQFPKRVYYTCNPGGQGHQYIKRIFIDREYKEGEHSEDYSFIQSLVTDNKALMREQPEYVQQLEALPEKLRKAWLYGDWDIFEGQFFEDFITSQTSERTHVIEPFDIPGDWTIYRSYDFGYNKPFSCGWWAIDHDGVAYRILELYGCTKEPNEGVKWEPKKQFQEIHRIETEHPWLKGKKIIGVADPSIWDASRGESVAETAAKCGVYFSPGDNNRVTGWMQCHYRLAFDENGFAMMYVFKNCTAFIRTIPLLMTDDCKPEDLDTSLEDHVADEWRYFCMARPIKPRTSAKVTNDNDNPMYAALNIKTEDLPKKQQQPSIKVLS